MRQELGWYICGLLVSVVAGLLTGFITLLPLLFSAGYVVWLLWRMANIVAWLERGAAAVNAPPTTGLMNRVVGLIHQEKKYSRKQRNRYRSALARFNSLAAELPDATVVLDEMRQIRWCNAASGKLLNIIPERDIGQRIDNLMRTPELQQFLNSTQSGQEVEIQAPANSQLTLSVMKVKTGKGMTVLIARDITQRVQLREMRKAFVADVSHELRTPLTVIHGYLELLVEDDAMSSSTKHALLNVQEQSDRMNDIVEHLLQLSRLESGTLDETEGLPVNVADLLRSIVSTQRKTTGAQHAFELCLSDDLSLLGNESELFSACNNLIANAVNYTDEGTKIRVTWHINGLDNPELVVEDNGQGIEQKHLPRLSERFYRVDKNRSRKSGGTGLGLAIVKHAVQRHGGQLHIDSTPGKGSIFRLEFPNSRISNALKVVNS